MAHTTGESLFGARGRKLSAAELGAAMLMGGQVESTVMDRSYLGGTATYGVWRRTSPTAQAAARIHGRTAERIDTVRHSLLGLASAGVTFPVSVHVQDRHTDAGRYQAEPDTEPAPALPKPAPRTRRLRKRAADYWDEPAP